MVAVLTAELHVGERAYGTQIIQIDVELEMSSAGRVVGDVDVRPHTPCSPNLRFFFVASEALTTATLQEGQKSYDRERKSLALGVARRSDTWPAVVGLNEMPKNETWRGETTAREMHKERRSNAVSSVLVAVACHLLPQPPGKKDDAEERQQESSTYGSVKISKG